MEKEAVKVMANIIKGIPQAEIFGYRWIVTQLMKHYQLEDMDINAWNGGSNRAKHFFPKHYFPLKVLEKWGMIAYFGNGSILRLR